MKIMFVKFSNLTHERAFWNKSSLGVNHCIQRDIITSSKGLFLLVFFSILFLQRLRDLLFLLKLYEKSGKN